MDPDAVIVVASAVSAGAAAGLKDTATQAVKDTYAALKRLIAERYSDVDVSAVEENPGSEAERTLLAQGLTNAGAVEDIELLEVAHRLIVSIQDHAADSGPTIGINLARLEAAALRIAGLSADGSISVDAEDVTVTNDIEITNVSAGRSRETLDPPVR